MARAATFSRIKVWVKEKLKYRDLDAEFDNILSNFIPEGMGCYSQDTTMMRLATDPAPYTAGVQVESLATALSGEIERLRFAWRRLGATPFWYSDLGRSLAVNPDDLVAFMGFEGETAADAYSDVIARGGIINPMSSGASAPTSAQIFFGGPTADFLSSNITTSQFKFGRSSMTCGAAIMLGVLSRVKNIGSISCHFRNLTAGDYIAYNPLLGLEFFLDASGFLKTKLTRSTSAVEGAKDVQTITGTVSRAGNTSWQHALLNHTTGNINGAATDALQQFLAGSNEGTAVAAANLLSNPGNGGVWLIGCKRNDPAWDKFNGMKTTPDNDAANPWTIKFNINSQAGAGTVSNGVLTVTPTGVGTLFYISPVAFAAQLSASTTEAKVKLVSAASDINGIEVFSVSDVALNRQVTITMFKGKIKVTGLAQTTEIPLDTENFHVIRMTSLGAANPVTKIYIDGVLVYTALNSTAAGVGSNIVEFGVLDSNASGAWEYISYQASGATVFPPVVGNTSGNLDDFSVMAKICTADLISQLLNNSAQTVFGKLPNYGLALPLEYLMSGAVGGAGIIVGAEMFFPSDGRRPITWSFAGHASSAAAGNLSATEDDVFNLHTESVTIAALKIAMTGKKTFKLGLRKASLTITGAGANTAVGKFTLTPGGNGS